MDSQNRCCVRIGEHAAAWVWFSFVVLAGSVVTPAVASESIVGDWQLQIDGGGEIYAAQLEISTPGNDGAISAGRFSADGRTRPLQSIRVIDGIWYVEARVRRGGLPAVATLAFEQSGDFIAGDIDFDTGASVSSYEFSGRRIAGGKIAESPDEVVPSEKNALSDTKAASPSIAASPSKPRILEFQNGFDGYDAATDTEIWRIAPDTILDQQGTGTADGNNGGGESQVLMRFDDIFGTGDRQLVGGSRIAKATLVIVAFDPGTTVHLHRVLVPWSAASTWNGMDEGVAIDDLEASTVRDGFSFGEIVMDKQQVEFDVTDTVQRWSQGDSNYGWVFSNTGSNGWDFYTSDWTEKELRPKLIIEFQSPPVSASQELSN